MRLFLNDHEIKTLIFKPWTPIFKTESYFNGKAEFIVHFNTKYGIIQL